MMGSHELFGKIIPFRLNNWSELKLTPMLQHGMRCPVIVGSYTWSIQASEFHKCAPQTSGDSLDQYTNYEIAGWDPKGKPVDAGRDLNFIGFGLDKCLMDLSSELITYGNVYSSTLYRVLTHCLLLDLAGKNPAKKTGPQAGSLTCKGCHEVYPMAEPNLPNGGFKCYSCRNWPFYK